MPAVYLNPLTDFGFKKLFGEEPHKDLLISFLNTLLPEYHQIADLQYTKNEYQGITPTDRKAIFDLNCISDRERTAYEDSLKHYRDLKNATDTARLEGTEEGFGLGLEKGKALGLEEGKALGLEEGKRDTARRMLAKGMTVELVADLTGLSAEQVQTLV